MIRGRSTDLQYSHNLAATFIVSPKIGQLTFGIPTFADDHWTGVHPCAKTRRNAEITLIVHRKPGHFAFNRKKAHHASRIVRRSGAERPRDDHLVADIGMHHT